MRNRIDYIGEINRMKRKGKARSFTPQDPQKAGLALEH
jgi:hypothetical protein